MRLSRPSFSQSLATAGLAATLTCTTLPALAAGDHNHAATPAAAEQARQQAADHTQALMALQKRWANAQGAEKSRALQQMIARAEERRAFLAELAKTHPAEALRVAIPNEKQLGMPAEVAEKLEQTLELEGELEIIQIDDFDNPGNSRVEHALKTPFGERFVLQHLGKSNDKLQSGQKLRLQGLLINSSAEENPDADGTVVFGPQDEEILSLAADSTASYGSVPGALPDTIGVQKTLVLMVNFQDKPGDKPWSKAQMQSLMDNQVNAYYNEASYGQTSFNTTVMDWSTLPLSSATCDRTTLTSLADQAASNAGYNLNSYDRLVYSFPRNACSWGGLGTVGGLPSRAWLNGSFAQSTFAHELGHNLGLYHSHDLDCGTATIGASCSVREYGDTADLMGAGSGHFNAYQKDRLGWFGNKILTVSSSGSYTLAPHEFNSSKPLALKTLKEVDTATGAKTWYYIEYRQAIGFDSGLSFYSNGNLDKGLSIHTGADNNGNSSYMLDMTPGTAAWYDAALDVGRTFSDSIAGVTITTQWAGSDEAIADISVGPQVCSQNTPTVSLSGGGSWVEAGTPVSYTVTVTNRDSNECASGSFSLSKTVPSGWSGSLNKGSLTLAPGASGSATLTVTSPVSASDGFYDVRSTAAKGSYSATASTSYVIDSPSSNSTPVANNDSASTGANTPVTINVLSNDSDPDGDSLSVTSVSGVNGTATINSNGSITYTPPTGYSGTETFSYSISDGKGGNASATVSVTVSAPTSSNKAPVAVNDSVTLNSVESVNINVLGNDWDPDNDSLQLTTASQGNKGSVEVNANGTLTYTPAKSFKNSDSFSYTITDGQATASATVDIQLAGDSTGGPGNGKGKNAR